MTYLRLVLVTAALVLPIQLAPPSRQGLPVVVFHTFLSKSNYPFSQTTYWLLGHRNFQVVKGAQVQSLPTYSSTLSHRGDTYLRHFCRPSECLS